MKELTLYSILLFAFVISSCKKFVVIDLPKNQITTDYVFEDSLGTNAAVTGIYIDMLQSFGLGFNTGGITAYTGLSSDELYFTGNNQNQEFYAANILPVNSTILTLWTGAYKYIYEINACIEGIKRSSTLIENQKNLFLGELLTMRSFLYFNLVNLYGAVPLVISTDYQENRLLKRTSENEVYLQIIADLQLAKSLLTKKSEDNTRVGYYTASALLARVYLYTKNYKEAKFEASNVINSMRYSIETDLNDVFKANSREIIWGFTPVYPGRETWEGYYFVPTSEKIVPTYVIADELYMSFERDDLRKYSWIAVNTSGGVNYPIPYKYKLNALQNVISEKYSVFRLAEQYLIRAEAQAYLDEIVSAESDLNIIRQRSGMSFISGFSKDQLIDLIRRERRWEMMCEWGHRWYDLKRNDLVDEVLGSLKSNWKSTARLYPIPQTEINSNINLIQNPGY